MISTQAWQHDFYIPAIPAGCMYYGPDQQSTFRAYRVFSQTGSPYLGENLTVAFFVTGQGNEEVRHKGISGV